MAEEEEKSFWQNAGGVLGRGLDAGIDALAERVPLAGRPIQAMVNTEGYQDIQAARDARKKASEIADEQLKALQLKNKQAEIDAERDPENYARQVAKENLAMEAMKQNIAANEQGMTLAKREEERKDAEEKRKSERAKRDAELFPAEQRIVNANATKAEANAKVAQEEAKLAREQATNIELSAYRTERAKTIRQALENGGNMSSPDLDLFMKSPETQAEITSGFWLQKLQKAVVNKDQGALNDILDAVEKQGWSIYTDENGVSGIDFGNGERIPATPDGIKTVLGRIDNAFNEEYALRLKYDPLKMDDDITLQVYGPRVRDLANYNGGSFRKAERDLQRVGKNATQQQKNIALLHAGVKVARNGTPEEQLKAFSMLTFNPLGEDGKPKKSVLEQAGFKWSGNDASSLIITDKSTDRSYTLPQFFDMIEKMDVLGQVLDAELEKQKMSAFSKMDDDERKAYLAMNYAKAESSKQGSKKNDVGNGSDNAAQAQSARDNAYSYFSNRYKDEFNGLDERKKDKAINGLLLFNQEVARIVQAGVDIDKLSLEQLEALDAYWNKNMPDGVNFQSPVYEDLKKKYDERENARSEQFENSPRGQVIMDAVEQRKKNPWYGIVSDPLNFGP